MTLIEIMVVITILGMIACAVGLAVVSELQVARRKTASTDMESLESGLKLYYAQEGHYPETSEGLAALVAARQIDKLPIDPWGHPYAYVNLGGRHHQISSFGADGQPGGEGDDADIVMEVPAPQGVASL